MSLVLAIIVVAVVLAVLAGVVVLAFWDLPAPTTSVEKVLPDARFSK